MSSKMMITGLRSIEECLDKSPEKIQKILLPQGKLNLRLEAIKQKALAQKIKIESNPKSDPDQPIIAFVKEHQYLDQSELIQKIENHVSEGKRPVVVVLDQITDPQNLGAILRTCAFMGVDGVFIPKDRAAGINEIAYKIASGGVEHLSIAQVTNVSQCLKAIKEAGLWTVGFSEHAEKDTSKLLCDFPVAIVIGNEEKGLRPLVMDNCDHLVKIPNKGGLQSLNASVAAALALTWATNLFTIN